MCGKHPYNARPYEHSCPLSALMTELGHVFSTDSDCHPAFSAGLLVRTLWTMSLRGVKRRSNLVMQSHAAAFVHEITQTCPGTCTSYSGSSTLFCAKGVSDERHPHPDGKAAEYQLLVYRSDSLEFMFAVKECRGSEHLPNHP